VLAAVAVSVTLLLAPSRTAEAVDSQEPTLGQGYFLAYCASCHGADAHGDGPVAPALSRKPADLTKIAARRDGKFPLDELAAFIAGRDAPTEHGTREMPVWGKQFVDEVGEGDTATLIARDQMRTLLLYLKSIQR
jgi:mono/diheme cytochrome c family protein